MFIGAAVLVLVLVLFLGRDTPQPQPEGDNGDEDQVEYTSFTGRVLLNEEEIELNNTPLVDKGLLLLPLLELAEVVDVDTSLDPNNNIIFIGQPGQADQEDTDGELKIYSGNTDITPAFVVPRDDDYYVEAREAAAMLGLNYYENLFAKAAHLTDDTLPLSDGNYGVVARRDGRGWAPELRLSVSNGSISSVEYVELNEEGGNKFEDQTYLENWANANDVDPLALISQLESQLLETQSVAEVDIVSGATGSWRNFVKLASNALGKARVGAVAEPFPDGNYVVVGNPSAQGWTPVVEFSVSGGSITEYRYDDIDDDGNSKRENDQYLQNWRNAYPEVDPVAIIEEREENILVTQDPNLIDATTGATQWGINIKQYTTGALDHAVRTQMPAGYDTIYVFFGPETERGDRAQLLVAAAGEAIEAVDFSDYRNGIAKKFDEPYLANWRQQYSDVDPVALVAEMEAIFLETEDPDELDAISGATAWRDSFQELAVRALEFIRGN